METNASNHPISGQGVFLHGLPHHDFFMIAVPPSIVQPTVKALDPDYVKPQITMQDPETKQLFSAEVNAIWTVPLSETDDYKYFSLMAYGIEINKLVSVLKRRYPEIDSLQKFRFILL